MAAVDDLSRRPATAAPVGNTAPAGTAGASVPLTPTSPTVRLTPGKALPRSLRYWLGQRRLLLFGSIVGLMILVGALAPVLAPYDPIQTYPSDALQAPSLAHPLGTDNLGRDTLSRVIYGARISLSVAVIAVSIALTGGVTLGLLAGYTGGIVDDVLSRFIDAMLAFPGILLAIAIANTLGPSLPNAMLAVGIIGIPTYFRLTRGQVLQAREQDFVTAAVVLGASQWRVILRHVLPNIVNPLIVAASIASSGAILSLASLSFIGIGAQPPQPDWGSMIKNATGYLNNAPWLAFGPGVSIFLTVFSFSMLGDALRDALDPRLRYR
ncbi:MAG TPA: ABC transporter permease [Chloroflexota bacterium]|nr:ABC transporter permease [Chloroflexota bacterium]